MGLFPGEIPNFIQGVSQQPSTTRLASQAEEIINGYGTVAKGLLKRPPTNHIGSLGYAEGDLGTHLIDRGDGERYILTFRNGSLSVHDLTGSSIPVTVEDGAADYIGRAADMTAMTIEDYTVIVNKSVKAAMRDDVVQTLKRPVAIVTFLMGVASATYTIKINDYTASYTTPANDATKSSVNYICDWFAQKIRTDTGWDANASFQNLLVALPSGTDFNITVSDTLYNETMKVVKDSVATFAELPEHTYTGTQIVVAPSSDQTRTGGVYLEFLQSDQYAAGVWNEIAKPNRKIMFDPSTMPHSLVREPDGTFKFGKVGWGTCTAGDAAEAPEPSFIGTTIQDVFFYKNRLGFLADQNVILSRSGDYFNFWRKTATATQDVDPIDVLPTSAKVAKLKWAAVLNESVLLFADGAQFVMPAVDALTPSTITITQTTDYQANLVVRPAPLGSSVYFPTTRGTSLGVREYYLDGYARKQDARYVTDDVPSYLKGSVKVLTSCSNEGVLALVTEGEPDTIAVYRRADNGQTVQQSAWLKWRFPGVTAIVGIECVNSDLYLMLLRGSLYTMERMSLATEDVAGALPYTPRLDRQVAESAVGCTYSDTRLTAVLPYDPQADVVLVVTGGTSAYAPGYFISPSDRYAATCVFPGDFSKATFVVGVSYEFRYTFSTLMPRLRGDDGTLQPTTKGRLQLRRLSVNYEDTGYFRVEVTPAKRGTYTYPFTGREIGTGSSLRGAIGLETGTFRVPLMSLNTALFVEMVSNSHLPCQFTSGNWEGLYTPRSRV